MDTGTLVTLIANKVQEKFISCSPFSVCHSLTQQLATKH